MQKKRMVIWGTGVVGKLVIAEVVRHPAFELVGVGVSNPDKVGRDAADIVGLSSPTGVLATDSVQELVTLQRPRNSEFSRQILCAEQHCWNLGFGRDDR